MNLVEAILSKNHITARKLFKEAISQKKRDFLTEKKKIYVAENIIMEDQEEIPIDLSEARVKIVKARIRNGKVQRRKRVSNVAGYTFRKKGSGPAKLVRMSAQERRKRKLAARRGKIKRRAKLARIRMKLKRARMKRKALGL